MNMMHLLQQPPALDIHKQQHLKFVLTFVMQLVVYCILSLICSYTSTLFSYQLINHNIGVRPIFSLSTRRSSFISFYFHLFIVVSTRICVELVFAFLLAPTSSAPTLLSCLPQLPIFSLFPRIKLLHQYYKAATGRGASHAISGGVRRSVRSGRHELFPSLGKKVATFFFCYGGAQHIFYVGAMSDYKIRFCPRQQLF